MRRIGIIGGTFDPVHRGHISLALDAKEQGDLDEVMFMPAKLQPFKLDKAVSDGEMRLAMLRLAIQYIPGLTVSTVEMDMEGISYTYRTLREVGKGLAPEDKLYFITGTDTYLKLGIWKEAEALLAENAFIVGERPGYKSTDLRECKKLYEETFGTETILINNKRLDISATEIRERIEQGEMICDLVPEGVGRFIYEHKLYK
ncbi:MAG: nicotinate-nucleotide adenylyltransferase [Anaerovoracaceae bacterium]